MRLTTCSRGTASPGPGCGSAWATSEAATEDSGSVSDSRYSQSTRMLRASRVTLPEALCGSSSSRAAAVSMTTYHASAYSSGGSVSSTGSAPALK